MARILLIEDDPEQIKVTKIRLEAKGYQVVPASSAKEGIGKVQQEKVDLILMDMILPDMNGLEAAIKLKENPETKEIPIIALTAMNPPGFRQECFRAGINDFIKKPYEFQEILEKIEKALSNQG